MAERGGARPNSGRKPKDEENRIRDLMLPYSLVLLAWDGWLFYDAFVIDFTYPFSLLSI